MVKYQLALISTIFVASCTSGAVTGNPTMPSTATVADASTPVSSETTGTPTGSPPVTNSEVTHSEVTQCGLNQEFRHRTRGHGSKKVVFSPEALVFRSHYAVNTDGAPTSYHPDDPWGTQGKAINTICNGANIVDVDGTRVNYNQCRKLVELFKQARDSGWSHEGAPKTDFYGVATVGSSVTDKHAPCINDQAPYKGYMVSTTALIADPSRDRCDQARYLNSLEVPFIIMPRHRHFRSKGVNVGDLAVVYHPSSQTRLYAIVGDIGPSWGLGEGSVHIAKVLNGKDEDPKTRKEVYSYATPDVVTLMLPGERMSPPYTLERIQVSGESAFRRFGGQSRLNACIDDLDRT